MFSFFKRKKQQDNEIKTENQPIAEQHQPTESEVTTEEEAVTETEAVNGDTPQTETAASEESFDVDVSDDGLSGDPVPHEQPENETDTPETDDETNSPTLPETDSETNAAPPSEPDTPNEETVTETAAPEAADETDEAVISLEEEESPAEIPPAPTVETEAVELDLDTAVAEAEAAEVGEILSVTDAPPPDNAVEVAAVEEFEIGADVLAVSDAVTEDADTTEEEAEPLDHNEIKAAVQAMQQAAGTEIFDFGQQDAETEHTSDDELADEETNIPVLDEHAETVDANVIEAEMLAMEEAAASPDEHDPATAVCLTEATETVDAKEVEEQMLQMQADSEMPFLADVDAAEPPPAKAVLPENADTPETEKTIGWAARLRQGLTKSRDHMAKSLASVFGGGKIDEDLYEELETVLLTSDMGIEATEKLMDEVRHRVSLRGLSDGAELRQTLKDAVYDLLRPLEQPLVIPDDAKPFVIMMAGINGAGKTTSIGKLAKYFQAQGKSVVLAAGDTFRAAAREQLQEWGKRNGVTVISQASGDSAAVCFDAVEAAKARKIDIVLADTAGRLPTQLHLMEEIKKVKRVLQKAIPDAPHEVIVVLDANIGQNALNQVAAFHEALGVTGLIVTKLDGTAKGGVLAALASHHQIPVRYIGVGESIDDLRPFDTRAFVEALFGYEV